jgi:hypothetical protein
MKLSSVSSSVVQDLSGVGERVDEVLDLGDGHRTRLSKGHASHGRALNVRGRDRVGVDVLGGLTSTGSELESGKEGDDWSAAIGLAMQTERRTWPMQSIPFAFETEITPLKA